MTDKDPRHHSTPDIIQLCFNFAAEFPTNSLEMNAVANIFDVNSDGFIDYYEFVSALHPNRDPYRKMLDADQITEEVQTMLTSETITCRDSHKWFNTFPYSFLQVSRQVSQCNCPKRFQVEQISANRYRVSYRFAFTCASMMI